MTHILLIQILNTRNYHMLHNIFDVTEVSSTAALSWSGTTQQHIGLVCAKRYGINQRLARFYSKYWM